MGGPGRIGGEIGARVEIKVGEAIKGGLKDGDNGPPSLEGARVTNPEDTPMMADSPPSVDYGPGTRPFSPTLWSQTTSASLGKIPTPKGYLVFRLRQSEGVVAKKFGKLLETLEEAGWSGSAAKELFRRIFASSTTQGEAEQNLGILVEVLNSAEQGGWSQQQLENLLSDRALAQKIDGGFLRHLLGFLDPNIALKKRIVALEQEIGVLEKSLPSRASKASETVRLQAEILALEQAIKVLEEKIASNEKEGVALKITPEELTRLIVRMAKYDDGNFTESLGTMPDLLREWQMSNGGPRLQALIAFLDSAEVTIESLRELFSIIPGGEEAFLTMAESILGLVEVIPDIGKSKLAKLSVEILIRIATHPRNPPKVEATKWVEDILSILPWAVQILRGLGFRIPELDPILSGVARDQGADFLELWNTANGGPERGDFKPYLPKESQGEGHGRP